MHNKKRHSYEVSDLNDYKHVFLLRVAGFQFRFKPRDYLRLEEYQRSQGKCPLRQGFRFEYYGIPYNLMFNKCLLLDFEGKRRIGLATRK